MHMRTSEEVMIRTSEDVMHMRTSEDEGGCMAPKQRGAKAMSGQRHPGERNMHCALLELVEAEQVEGRAASARQITRMERVRAAQPCFSASILGESVGGIPLIDRHASRGWQRTSMPVWR